MTLPLLLFFLTASVNDKRLEDFIKSGVKELKKLEDCINSKKEELIETLKELEAYEILPGVCKYLTEGEWIMKLVGKCSILRMKPKKDIEYPLIRLPKEYKD